MRLNIILILFNIIITPSILTAKAADWRNAIYSYEMITRLEGIALDSRKPKEPINPCEFLNIKKIAYTKRASDPECIQSGETIAHTVRYHLCKDEVDWFDKIGNEVYKENIFHFKNLFNWYMYTRRIIHEKLGHVLILNLTRL